MRQRFADYLEQVRRLVARLWVNIPVIVGDAAGQASAVRLGDLSDGVTCGPTRQDARHGECEHRTPTSAFTTTTTAGVARPSRSCSPVLGMKTDFAFAHRW